LDDDKVKSYAQGVLKKSKREKEKEAEIAKRQQAERETAKAYEDFLQEFEGGKTTVASSTSGGTGLGFVKASGGGSYVPSLKPKEAIPTGPASMVRLFHSQLNLLIDLSISVNDLHHLLQLHHPRVNQEAKEPWTVF